MAISKAMLEGMGLTADQVKAILDEHFSTVDGLEKEAKKANKKANELQEQANRVPELEAEIKKLTEEAEEEAKKHEGKDYDALKKEYDDFKAETERKEVRAAKESAYKEILKDAGIAEKHWGKILKYSDVDGVELDEKGKITTAKEILKSIKEEWSDHIPETRVEGSEVETPPSGGAVKMTREEIMNIKDRNERQKAISENHELFGY